MARILIVEDDPTNAELVALICRSDRQVATVVENGVEALLLLDALPFDLVLTDLQMPRMDGLEMTRNDPELSAGYSGIPIIGLTARAGDADRAKMFSAGMDHVLTKPFSRQNLLAAMSMMLERDPDKVMHFRASGTQPLRSEDRLG